MKKRKLTLILIFVAILFLFVGICNFQKPKLLSKNSPLLAIPENSMLTFFIKDLSELPRFLKKDKIFWNNAKQFDFLNSFDSTIVFLDSIFAHNDDIESASNNRNTLISSFEKNNKFQSVMVVDMGKISRATRSKEHVLNALKKIAAIELKDQDNEQIYFISPLSNSYCPEFYFGYIDQLLIFSDTYDAIISSLAQYKSKNGLQDEEILEDVFEEMSKSDYSLLINNTLLSEALKNTLNKESKFIGHIVQEYGQWSYYVMHLKNEVFSMKGQIYSSDSTITLSGLFKNQKASQSNILKILPENTNLFQTIVFDDFEDYTQNLDAYLEKTSKLNERNNLLGKLKQEYNTDFTAFFNQIADDEASQVFTQNGLQSFKSFFCIKTKGKRVTKEKLEELAAQFPKTEKNIIQDFRLDEKNIWQIFKFPAPNIGYLLFGPYFETSQANFCMPFEEYLIFSSSSENLEQFAKDYFAEKLLTKNNVFDNFSEILEAKYHTFFYINPKMSQSLIKGNIGKELKKVIDQNSDIFNNIGALAVQMKATENGFSSQIFSQYWPSAESGLEMIWQSYLENELNQKPSIVQNHKTGEKCLFIQDANHVIYLIDKSGKTLWKNQLDKPIISDVYQIDYYKNKKLQIVFNTATYIYMLDMEGKNVEDYPIKLASEASNGIAIFDLDKTKDYRMLIACKNHKVYNFSKEAKLIKEWKFGSTAGRVHLPIQYCSVKDKDYYVFADQSMVYFTNRKGEPAFKPLSIGNKSRNVEFYMDLRQPKKPCLITTDSTGTLFRFYFDGSTEKDRPLNYTPNHFFDYADVSGDGQKDYIFTDKEYVEVFDNNYNLIFRKEFENDILDKPAIFNFGEKRFRIGVFVQSENSLYLMDALGGIEKNFPLSASGFCSITFPEKGSKTTTFSMIFGAPAKKLVNYQIK